MNKVTNFITFALSYCENFSGLMELLTFYQAETGSIHSWRACYFDIGEQATWVARASFQVVCEYENEGDKASCLCKTYGFISWV